MNVSIFIFNYRYPTKEEFIHVAMEIIRKYPFMKSLTGTPSVGFILHSKIFVYAWNYDREPLCKH